MKEKSNINHNKIMKKINCILLKNGYKILHASVKESKELYPPEGCKDFQYTFNVTYGTIEQQGEEHVR